ncbi:hypothetical protein, partial [Anaplasma phagocytophilum]|uniref:hypothetical protein n=1 Tax=Anaplasma phagocytophilum TaxID=948 RepID=UPI00201A42EF
MSYNNEAAHYGIFQEYSTCLSRVSKLNYSTRALGKICRLGTLAMSPAAIRKCMVAKKHPFNDVLRSVHILQ